MIQPAGERREIAGRGPAQGEDSDLGGLAEAHGKGRDARCARDIELAAPLLMKPAGPAPRAIGCGREATEKRKIDRPAVRVTRQRQHHRCRRNSKRIRPNTSGQWLVTMTGSAGLTARRPSCSPSVMLQEGWVRPLRQSRRQSRQGGGRCRAVRRSSAESCR
jgi:hypothetical protein